MRDVYLTAVQDSRARAGYGQASCERGKSLFPSPCHAGGALAIGCANRNLIMENSVYYVASPEACAAILWKSRAAAGQVRDNKTKCTQSLCLTASCGLWLAHLSLSLGFVSFSASAPDLCFT